MTFALLGKDLFGNPIERSTDSPVEQKFLFSPFSVLSARDGDWANRKKAWASFGIQGEIGRDAASIHCPTISSDGPMEDANYTSIFDPVLCECVYRWFARSGSQVVDPFSGGSVRGVVASLLGRRYWGSDLRQEQIEANRRQVEELCQVQTPEYVCGDSMLTLDTAPFADLIFTCPPYGDLETYSNDSADLSNMEWHTFIAAYSRIILRACRKLKGDRFACFVVSNFRDSRGFIRDLVGETIRIFEECRCHFYNEAVLVTSIGSAAMRVTKQFEASRKFCKTHQNVLVFCKGDPEKATKYVAHDPPRAAATKET